MPSQPAPQLDQPAVLEFPFSGMDSSAEFELQPAGTTVFGSNVRTFEAQTLRGRGGSRPGLTAHVNDQLPGAIQCMGIVSIASPDAALTDDGIGGQTNPDDPGFNPGYTGGGGSTTGGGPSGFVLDPSDDTLFDHGKRKKPRNPAPHWKWRRGGSGVHRPKRKQRRLHEQSQTPTAVDDSISCSPGDDPVEIRILDNDAFLGEPTVRLMPLPYLGGGTLVKDGTSIDTLFVYTPPATSASGGTFTVQYELSAKGNKGKATANVVIELAASPPPSPPSPPPPPASVILTILSGLYSAGGPPGTMNIVAGQPFTVQSPAGALPGLTHWELVSEIEVNSSGNFVEHESLGSGSISPIGVCTGLPLSFTCDGLVVVGTGGSYSELTIQFVVKMT